MQDVIKTVAIYTEDAEDYDAIGNRYLTFNVDGTVYGLQIKFVKEIVGMQKATKVPETPDFVKGVINLRGHIVPLIDMRLKFGISEIPYTDRTCVVVASAHGVTVGLIVDAVDDVISIDPELVSELPEDGRKNYESRYIVGLGKADGGIQQLLGIDKLLTAI
ncbi:MAG: chemotaxis protein CheW [Clostridiales Family XIII bacterium]|jgi:purine-binding chemotaxis protein CheW|nr:chemotaxis protein CheW [Clostridiales Family XIII bacterium]